MTGRIRPLPIRKPAPSSDDLPRHLTSFIGRSGEIADITELIVSRPLTTLTGPGGCGKTRLALRGAETVADRFGSGVVWADLSSITDGAAVPSALAMVAGLRESPPLPLLDILAGHFERLETLILLDNCEHIIEACAALADELLRRCPSLRILATSREPLGIEGETVYLVPPMPIAPEVGDHSAQRVETYDGARLFVERATRARPDFALTDANAQAVATICRRLDGMPLAIELAAARVRTMGIEQIAQGLDDRFNLLTRGPRASTPRHRTLQASLDWSHELLDDSERQMFRRLSVFAGAFSLEAVASVCDGDPITRSDVLSLLTQLVEKSLVTMDDVRGTTRYRLLETLRHYARERLEEHADESDRVRDRHLEHFLSEGQRAEVGLATPAVLEWLERIDAERENFHAALAWGQRAERVELTARLACALVRYWQHRGRFDEGRSHLQGVLASKDLPTPLRAKIATAAARLALRQWDLSGAEALATEALTLAREDGDHALAAHALVVLGWTASFTGRHDEARDYFGDGHEFAERSGDSGALARALCGFGQVPWSTGEWNLSRPLFERSIIEARASGQLDVLLEGLHYLCLANWMAGRDVEAEAAASEGLELATNLGDPEFHSQFLSFRAALRVRSGDIEAARALLAEAWTWAERSGSLFPRSFYQSFHALLARAEGDLEATVSRCEPIAGIGLALGVYVPAAVLFGFAAEASCLLGNMDEATRFAASAVEAQRRAGGPIAAAPWASAVVSFTKGDLDEGIEQCHEALAFAMAADSRWYALEALELLGCTVVRSGDSLEGTRLLAAADAGLATAGWPRAPTLVDRYEESMGRARTALGEAFDDAVAAGRRLTLEEAVAYARRGRGERRRPTSGWDSLTPAELEVVRLVAQGMTNPQIAEKLFVSRATVKAHLGHIFPKLGVATRAELAAEVARRDV